MTHHDACPPSPRDDGGNFELRQRSGQVNSDDPLAGFLYLLLRDDLPAGRVEAQAREAVARGGGSAFSNGFLASYALDVAARLRGGGDHAAPARPRCPDKMGWRCRGYAGDLAGESRPVCAHCVAGRTGPPECGIGGFDDGLMMVEWPDDDWQRQQAVDDLARMSDGDGDGYEGMVERLRNVVLPPDAGLGAVDPGNDHRVFDLPEFLHGGPIYGPPFQQLSEELCCGLRQGERTYLGYRYLVLPDGSMLPVAEAVAPHRGFVFRRYYRLAVVLPTNSDSEGVSLRSDEPDRAVTLAEDGDAAPEPREAAAVQVCRKLAEIIEATYAHDADGNRIGDAPNPTPGLYTDEAIAGLEGEVFAALGIEPPPTI